MNDVTKCYKNGASVIDHCVNNKLHNCSLGKSFYTTKIVIKKSSLAQTDITYIF